MERVTAPSELKRIPADFDRAAAVLREAVNTPHVTIAEIPAPGRLAPWALALGAEVFAGPAAPPAGAHPAPVAAPTGPVDAGEDEPDELATGRIVVLYDPAAPAEWGGAFRIVSYIRAELERDLGHEAMLGSVAWSWLTEALEDAECEALSMGGTTTRVLSESFGTLAERPSTIDLEMRASWTPVLAAPERIGDHLEAWVALLSTAAGLPPLPAGVTPLPGRRR